MVDPRVLHQVTVEIATGFLTLAGVTVGLKLVSDGWRRHFAGRSWLLDKWSRQVGAFAEPTSFVALALGVLVSFVTSWTGLNVWPAAVLWSDPTVRNKMLLVSLSTTLFVGALAIRARYKAKVWLTPSTGAFYALLVIAGNVALVLQNSVGGHLQGTGSLLDDLLAMVNINETILWTLPTQAAIALALGFPFIVLLLGLQLRASNRVWARRELAPLAREVKGLLAEAKRADLGVDHVRRLIGRANFAARHGQYAAAFHLLEKAKAGLEDAHAFSGSVDEVEFWADVAALRAEEPAAFRAPSAAQLPPTTGPSKLSKGLRPKPVPVSPGALANLPGAMSLVEGSLRKFEEAPLLRLQAELRGARDAILEFKSRGADLTQPVRMLKAAHAHLVRAEWADAVECLEQFRRDMKRVAESDEAGPRRAERSESPGPSADDT